MTLAKILEVACSAAKNAGLKARQLREQSAISVASKSDMSLVTSGDYASDEIISAAIRESFPEHLILSEEAQKNPESIDLRAANLWIVDPIDGTTNYVYGQPHCAVSIAYASAGQVQAAAVYSIFMDELFHAAIGKGAFLNGKTIVCNNTSEVSHAVVATGLPYKRPISDRLSSQIINVSNYCRDLRRLAAASLDLCFVACGRLDAYFETIQSWDMAAGSLIVREAGGSVCNLGPKNDKIPPDLDGNELLACCTGIKKNLSSILSD